MQDYSDEKLVEKIREGDKEALELLLKRYRRDILNHVEKFKTLSNFTSEDVIEECSTLILSAINVYDSSISSFADYFHYVIINGFISSKNVFTKSEFCSSKSLDIIFNHDTDKGKKPNMIKDQITELYLQLHYKLSDFELKCLWLKALGYNYQDIARAYCTNLYTVEEAIRNTREKAKEIGVKGQLLNLIK